MKKRKCLIFGSLLIIILIIGIFLIANRNSKKEFSYMPVFYQICDDDNCNYLLGSMHVGDNRITKFNKKVIKAYNKSDALAVELDITEASIDPNDLVLEDNLTIDDLINEDLKNKLVSFSEKHLLFPYDSLKIYIPGYLSSYLASLVYLELGYLGEGVDSYFLNLAHEEDKEIIPLETLEFQLSFFTNFSDEFYINMIEDVIDNYDEEKKLGKELYELYLTGSENKLVEFLESETDDELNDEEKLYNKMMIEDRNIGMSKNIKEFLKDDKDVFVVVGLAHVLGEDGIIDILANENFEIKRIK